MRRAFTLVELLIVLIILGVLAALVVPKFNNSSLRSKEGALRAMLKIHRAAIGRFRSDAGLWPNTLNGLARSNAPSWGRNDAGTQVAISNWKGPYLTVVDNASPTPLTSQIARDPVSGVALLLIAA